MKFKAEFIQIIFQSSADFIQPPFHLFCDVVIRQWSVCINGALLSLFFDSRAFMIYVHELKIKLFKIRSAMEQWRISVLLAKRVTEDWVSPPPPLFFIHRSSSNSLNAVFPDLRLEGKNLSLQL